MPRRLCPTDPPHGPCRGNSAPPPPRLALQTLPTDCSTASALPALPHRPLHTDPAPGTLPHGASHGPCPTEQHPSPHSPPAPAPPAVPGRSPLPSRPGRRPPPAPRSGPRSAVGPWRGSAVTVNRRLMAPPPPQVAPGPGGRRARPRRALTGVLVPAAPPAAPPPRLQGRHGSVWRARRARLGSAWQSSAQLGTALHGTARRDGPQVAPPRPTPRRPAAAAARGMLEPDPGGTGRDRALPPPCAEPRPLITANYSPGAAAAPPCSGPGQPPETAPAPPLGSAGRVGTGRGGPGQGGSAGPVRSGGVRAAAGPGHTLCPNL